ncbi:hypothetical protein DYBT9275_05644 [Dyadobacter sp. CECT 9275]|uniref:Uncharacterized protein n=1 Tax=Dyadobacter helix TaxID=2822344 RepID=A0A916N8K1_9BACT|nr:hypothetical protein [Dyadobacter sp. CECT 9275]CAG5016823.1 hypothetical protein DYBT9275_05644 [Dyadobacter sp. CECT 9275]
MAKLKFDTGTFNNKFLTASASLDQFDTRSNNFMTSNCNGKAAIRVKCETINANIYLSSWNIQDIISHFAYSGESLPVIPDERLPVFPDERLPVAAGLDH